MERLHLLLLILDQRIKMRPFLIVVIWGLLLLKSNASVDDELYQQARIWEDLWRLDASKVVSDKSHKYVLAELDSNGVVGYSGVTYDTTTGDMTLQNRDQHQQVHIICGGTFINVIDLTPPAKRSDITYSVERHPAQVITSDYEDKCTFSPYRAVGKYAVLISLSGTNVAKHLSSFPDTYLLSPAVSAEVSQFFLPTEEIINKMQTGVILANLGTASVAEIQKEPIVEQIIELKRYLAKNSEATGEAIRKLSSDQKNLPVLLTIGLGLQNDRGASDSAVKDIIEGFSVQNSSSLQSTLIGLLVIEESGRMSIDNLKLLRSKVQDWKNISVLSQRDQELISLLSN